MVCFYMPSKRVLKVFNIFKFRKCFRNPRREIPWELHSFRIFSGSAIESMMQKFFGRKSQRGISKLRAKQRKHKHGGIGVEARLNPCARFKRRQTKARISVRISEKNLAILWPILYVCINVYIYIPIGSMYDIFAHIWLIFCGKCWYINTIHGSYTVGYGA